MVGGDERCIMMVDVMYTYICANDNTQALHVKIIFNADETVQAYQMDQMR